MCPFDCEQVGPGISSSDMVLPETLREIEALFLLGRYEEAVQRCKVELKIIEVAHRNALKSDEDGQNTKSGTLFSFVIARSDPAISLLSFFS